ncbi:hypothetical protein ZWY2020_048718 [Hordeum vulgare]|nr:hypothetical protein ZWY2020_048718 [Hordeum vulgare]
MQLVRRSWEKRWLWARDWVNGILAGDGRRSPGPMAVAAHRNCSAIIASPVALPSWVSASCKGREQRSCGGNASNMERAASRQMPFPAVVATVLLQLLSAVATAAGCSTSCGNISIPYPFGIEPDCYHDGFNLTCDYSYRPPKLFLGDGTVEVLEISIPNGTVRINSTNIMPMSHDIDGASRPNTSSSNSFCQNYTRYVYNGYQCRCSPGYRGNPYILEGCQDIDECVHKEAHSCHGICQNTPGIFYCRCPDGTYGNPPSIEGGCIKITNYSAGLIIGMVLLWPENGDIVVRRDGAEREAVGQGWGVLLQREPKWVLAIEERCKFLVLGKTRGNSSSNIKFHVFCPMLNDKRDAIRLIANRWKLSVQSVGWEPKRFITVHVTPKSKVPARVLGSKPGVPVLASHPYFDPMVDMDPRLVVAMMDLPRDADVNSLVLRFGGECELVWLNDKNAVAVFSDSARAATVLRRLDYGYAYQGAAMFCPSSITQASLSSNVWVGAPRDGGMSSASPCKKDSPSELKPNPPALMTVLGRAPGTSVLGNAPGSVWKPAVQVTGSNRWNALESDAATSFWDNRQTCRDRGSSFFSKKTESSAEPSAGQSVSKLQPDVEVEDWEEIV